MINTEILIYIENLISTIYNKLHIFSIIILLLYLTIYIVYVIYAFIN